MKELRISELLNNIKCFLKSIANLSTYNKKISKVYCLEPNNIIDLGNAWSTNTINTVIFRHHGVISEDGNQYTAFYKDEKSICFVKRNLINNIIQTSILPGNYNVYDAHNSISIGIDRQGYLHLSYDQHGNELRYRRSSKPHIITEWTEMSKMTTLREKRITYPTFLQTAEKNGYGSLLYLYREGGSSNGDAYIKEYNEETGNWQDRKSSILKGTEQKPWTCGPYWANPVIDMNGRIHIFFTWRTHSIGENRLINNINIDYAYSNDKGQSWYTSRDVEYNLPITPVNSETIFAVSPGSNLINQTGSAIDSLNRPHLVFYSDDAVGVPQYQHLWNDRGKWKHSFLSARDEDFSLFGNGALQIPISRPEILIDKKNFVYVIYRGDLTDNQMAVQRLSPPNYEPPGLVRILWNKPVDYAEPVVDRIRWAREGVLTMLIQKNYQPPHDQKALASVEPIYLIDWNIEKGWD